jgi:hypothetical protein
MRVAILSPTEEQQGWSCAYEIDWPAGLQRKLASGVDALQAMHLALQRIGTDLYTSNEHLEGRLRWKKVGDGYGFPVPKNLRGVLVGLDREFDG